MNKKNPHNGGWSIIAPEKIQINTTYAFTLSPHDDYQYSRLDGEARKDKFIEWVTGYVVPSLPSESLLVSECSAGGRLHLHGTLCFPTIRCIEHFYLYWIPHWKEKCNCELDTIESKEVWDTYLDKQRHFSWYKMFKTPDALLKRLKTAGPKLYSVVVNSKNQSTIKYKPIVSDSDDDM